MLFNSWTFVVFFVVVYALYWALRHDFRWQNALLLLASYLFYGWWDWRFLGLLIFSTGMDYILGNCIANQADPRRRRRWLVISVCMNLGILGFFKYFNFFTASTVSLAHSLGFDPSFTTLNIVLPVGISFYTFQSMSYTIDIYRRDLAPAKTVFDFALYVAFFPQLVAGPIERSTALLPQLTQPRRFTADKIGDGLVLILCGMFKKICIADNVGLISDQIFNHYSTYHGVDLILASLAFAVQIYCDFSGYTDIARGVAKTMGFELSLNFRLPYFATNPAEFWHRWHISLSTWLRDYLYIPLGGNRHGTANTYKNIFVTMLLGGLWHGAAWNFVLWGGYHGALLIAHRWYCGQRAKFIQIKPLFSRPVYLAQIVGVFVLVVVGWVFFRCRNLEQISYFFTHAGLGTSGETSHVFAKLAFFTLPLLAAQAVQWYAGDLIPWRRWRTAFQIASYSVLIAGLQIFGAHAPTEFIYFQF